MFRDKPARLAIGFLGLTLAVSACSLGPGHSAVAQQDLRRVGCPDDIESDLVIPHACFLLRVPADWRHPGKRQVNVFVGRLSPPGKASADPVLVLGNNVGDTSHYAGFAAGPGRTHRVFYVLEPRGTGHSTPSLACPETHRLSTTTPDLVPQLRRAVRSCRNRLLREGVNPRLQDLGAVAADANALRQALHLSEWNLLAIGSASHYAVAIARSYPASTRAMILDSPDTLQAVGAPEAGIALTAAWQNLVDDCKTQPTCQHSYPTLATLWGRTAARLASHPIVVTDGGSQRVLDDEGLARLVRSYLAGPGPGAPGELPGVLRTLLHGQLPPAAQERLTDDHDVCCGYRTECGDHASALGAYLTVMCRTTATRADSRPSPTLPPGMAALDKDNPYRSACAEWGEQPAEPANTAPAGIPSLALTGALDPFAAGGIDAGQAIGKGHFLVEFPGQTHNALGFDDCPIDVRNAWLDDPKNPPSTACVRQLPPLPFTLS
jgi:hypothetical protein